MGTEEKTQSVTAEANGVNTVSGSQFRDGEATDIFQRPIRAEPDVDSTFENAREGMAWLLKDGTVSTESFLSGDSTLGKLSADGEFIQWEGGAKTYLSNIIWSETSPCVYIGDPTALVMKAISDAQLLGPRVELKSVLLNPVDYFHLLHDMRFKGETNLSTPKVHGVPVATGCDVENGKPQSVVIIRHD